LRIKQKEIYVNHDASTAGSMAGNQAGMQAAMNPQVTHGTFAGGAAAGLVGALFGMAIDAAVDAHRSGVAEDLAKPIRANTASIDFNTMIERSLADLDKSKFASDVHVVRLDTTPLEDERANRLAPAEPALVLIPSYFVAYDESVFVYQVAALVVDRKSVKGKLVTTERYKEVFRYSAPRSQYSGVEHWSELSADQWKELFQAANNEIIAMLNYDIAARPSEASGSTPVEKENGDRMWVRRPLMLHSVAKSALPPEKHS
jgi:hypothetical protein